MTPAEFAAGFRGWLSDNADALRPFRKAGPPAADDAVAGWRVLQRMLYDSGWNRWGWPRECGGFGGPAVLRGLLYDELAEAGLPIPDSMILLEALGPVVVDRAPELATTHLPAFLSGAETWSQGFSEPDTGSDPAGVRCRAERSGDTFVVNGRKIGQSWGHLAARCVLLTRTGAPDGHRRGLSVLLVDQGSPGVTVRPMPTAGGRNDQSEIIFEEVRVPAGRLIGAAGDGWSISSEMLRWERGMYAWQRQAVLHRELEDGLRGCDPERLTGGTLERLGAAYRCLHAVRLASRRTVRALSAGRDPGPVSSVDTILLATAERAVHESLRELARPRLELGDGPGDDLLRAGYLRSRAASPHGGNAQLQRAMLADLVLGLPTEPPR